MKNKTVYVIVGAYIEDGKALSDLLDVFMHRECAVSRLDQYLKDERKFPAYDNITMEHMDIS